MDLVADRKELERRLRIGSEALYLTKAECTSLGIAKKRILELTKQALVAHGRDEYEMPAKIGVHPFEDVFFHAMPAYVPGSGALGVKWIECYPRNGREYGLPQTTGLLILNDILTGCPIAIMDSTWITAMRTPAVTALAAAALHPNAETFGMFGCGVQGTEHVRLICHTLKALKKIYIFDTNAASMDRLIEHAQGEVPVEIVRAESPRALAERCEVMSSATLITRETLCIVKDEWVSKRQTILPCDLNTFWDPKITARADHYFVDSRSEHELFAQMGYFPDGLRAIDAETGEILAGLAKGRENADELIVCSNIGMAVCDVVVARALFDAALEQGAGRKLPL